MEQHEIHVLYSNSQMLSFLLVLMRLNMKALCIRNAASSCDVFQTTPLCDEECDRCSDALNTVNIDPLIKSM